MKKRIIYWVAIGAATVAAAVILAPLQAMPFGRDQSLHAVGAKLIGEHGLSVETFWFVRAPGIFLWHWLVQLLVGSTGTAARSVEWPWMLVTCLLAGAAAYRWTRDSVWAAVLATVTLAIRYVGGGFLETLQPAGLALLPMLGALALWGPAGQPRSLGRLVATGLLVGVATLFTGVAIWLVVLLIVAEFFPLARGESPARAYYTATVFAFAAVLLPLAYFGWMLATGSWSAIHVTLGAKVQAFCPAPRYFAVDIVIAVSVAVIAWREKALRTVALPLALLLFVFWLSTGIGAAPIDRVILYGPLAVTGAWLVVTGARWLARQGAGRRLGSLALVGFSATLLLGGPWLSAAGQWRLFSHYLGGEYVVAFGNRFNHAATDYSYFAVREMAGELMRQGKSGDRLFVWGAEPGLYQYSGLPPATRFLTHAPILTAADPVPLQQEVLDVMSFHAPELFVVRHDDARLPLLEGVRDSREALAEVPPLQDAVAHQYTLVSDRFGFAIYRLTAKGAIMPPY